RSAHPLRFGRLKSRSTFRANPPSPDHHECFGRAVLASIGSIATKQSPRPIDGRWADSPGGSGADLARRGVPVIKRGVNPCHGSVGEAFDVKSFLDVTGFVDAPGMLTH